MGRRSLIDKEKVITLFKKRFSYRQIAEHVGSNEDAIRMIIKRNAKADLIKRKEERSLRKSKIKDDELTLKNTNFLSIDDKKQIANEKRNGLDPNESIGTYAFLKWNRQSYKKGKDKKFIFDESRGAISYAVPKSY